MTWPLVNLSTALASAEVFVDGDWVESKDQDPNGDVRLIQLADVGDGEYIDKSARFLTSAKAQELRCTFLESGDLMVARMPDPLGRTCIFPGDVKPSVTVVDVCVIRPNRDEYDSHWLMHCLNAPACRNQIASFATGTTRSRISRSNLGKIKIPIPPLAEQRRIADILDRADVLRAKRQAALAQLDTLIQSIFFDLFGDPTTNPKGWPIQQLGNLGAGSGAIVDGPFGSAINVKKDYVEDGEIPVIRTKNVRPFEFVTDDLKRITSAKYKGLERSAVMPGDIIMTKVGTIGNVCLFPDTLDVGVLSTTGSCRIRPDESLVRRKYLAHFLHLYRGEMMKLIAQGVQPFLNMSHIKSFRVPLPTLAIQDDFAHRIAAVEKLKTAHRASLAKLDELFATLQHLAFRGEL